MSLTDLPIPEILIPPFPDVENPLLNFTRASGSGTRYNRLGLIETVSANQPRYDYDPVTGVYKGVLIKESRTNQVLYSEDFTNVGWSIGGVSVTGNSTDAPDDAITADLITATATTGIHVIGRGFQSGQTNGTNQAFSIFVKQGTTRYVKIKAGNTTTLGINVIFDLNLGTVDTETLGTGRIQPLPNGWYRLKVSGAAGATGNTGVFAYLLNSSKAENYTATGSETLYVWGAMGEDDANSSSSYIKTTTATVTRSADLPDFTDLGWYNDSKGAFVVSGRTALGGGTQTLLSVDDGTANERMYLQRNSSDEIHFIVVDGGTTQADLNLGTVADDTEFKVAVSYELNSISGSLNGGAVVTDSVATLPTVTTAVIGSDYANANHWNSTIESIPYYPNTLTSAQLIALSR